MPTVIGPKIFSFSPAFEKTHKKRFCCRPTSKFPSPVACITPKMSTSVSQELESKCSLSFLAPLEAILFDIDGTLCDSDPVHYYAFREMLQEVGFNGGEPITEEFFVKNISGMHNDELCHVLFPDWDFDKAMKFMEDKESMFRRLASEKLKPVSGVGKLCEWVERKGLKRAAVTNAPRPNAELILSMLGLSDFFELLIIGSECDRAKPFPDPYLRALQLLGVSHEHAFIFEDSKSGIKAGVAAGMKVIGLATRNPEELLKEAGSAFVIKDFEDSKLWYALEELNKKSQETNLLYQHNSFEENKVWYRRGLWSIIDNYFTLLKPLFYNFLSFLKTKP